MDIPRSLNTRMLKLSDEGETDIKWSAGDKMRHLGHVSMSAELGGSEMRQLCGLTPPSLGCADLSLVSTNEKPDFEATGQSEARVLS